MTTSSTRVQPLRHSSVSSKRPPRSSPPLRPLLAGLASLLEPVVLPHDLPNVLLRVYTRNGRVVLTESLDAAEGTSAPADGRNGSHP